MFGTILTTFYTLIFLYLLWRTASVPFIVRTVPRWCLVSATCHSDRTTAPSGEPFDRLMAMNLVERQDKQLDLPI